eukprot:5876545-Prymnesium_polylepis.1
MLLPAPQFFLDEYTALAAGHRPCACCRRLDFKAFRAAWARAHGPPPSAAASWSASAIDRVIHDERREPDDGSKRLHDVRSVWEDLPDGAMLAVATAAGGERSSWLYWQNALHRWSHDGYRERVARSDVDSWTHAASMTLLTPPSLVAVLREGNWHPGPPHESVLDGSPSLGDAVEPSSCTSRYL